MYINFKMFWWCLGKDSHLRHKPFQGSALLLSYRGKKLTSKDNSPVRTVAANKYCNPCSFTRVTISRAIAPVAADIIPGRPPVKAMITAIENEAYKPTLGSTPAMIENAMASGISASATTSPAKTSFRVLENHSWRIVSMDLYFFVDCRAVRA